MASLQEGSRIALRLQEQDHLSMGEYQIPEGIRMA